MLLNTYNPTLYPFTLRPQPLANYTVESEEAFGQVFGVDISSVAPFPVLSDITVGGILDHVLYTGTLRVGCSNSSLTDNNDTLDVITFNQFLFEDWWMTGVCLILSQQYGVLIQPIKVKDPTVTNDGIFLANMLGEKFNYSTDLKGGNDSLYVHIVIGQYSNTF